MENLPDDVTRKIGKNKLDDIVLKVRYKNWKNEIAARNIIPLDIYYGSTEYHKDEQWLLKVWDLDKKDYRIYALKDIQEWL